MKHSSFDATISALDAETSAFGAATSATDRRLFNATISSLDAETSALDAEMSALGAAMLVIVQSYWRYRRGVSGNIGNCGAGITPQMCNIVNNHGDMSTFSNLIPAALLPISVELSPIPAALLQIPEAKDGCAVSDADHCATH